MHWWVHLQLPVFDTLLLPGLHPVVLGDAHHLRRWPRGLQSRLLGGRVMRATVWRVTLAGMALAALLGGGCQCAPVEGGPDGGADAGPDSGSGPDGGADAGPTDG